MNSSSICPLEQLSEDLLRQILSHLNLSDAISCAVASRSLREALYSSPPPLLPPLRLLAVKLNGGFCMLDLTRRRWLPLRLPSSFDKFEFTLLTLAAASSTFLLLWIANYKARKPKQLVLYNPISRAHCVLPPPGSPWPDQTTVIPGDRRKILVLTELAVFSFNNETNRWSETPHNLPSTPISSVVISTKIYALCGVGFPWMKKWNLFSALLHDPEKWVPVDQPEWGDVVNVLQQPGLITSASPTKILMAGGLKSCFGGFDEKVCSAVIVLRLDLEKMEWDEAGRMPQEMYNCFYGTVKEDEELKVFGEDGMVWFSSKRVIGRMALWEEEKKDGGGRWTWTDGFSGRSEFDSGVCFEAGLSEIPTKVFRQ